MLGIEALAGSLGATCDFAEPFATVPFAGVGGGRGGDGRSTNAVHTALNSCSSSKSLMACADSEGEGRVALLSYDIGVAVELVGYEHEAGRRAGECGVFRNPQRPPSYYGRYGKTAWLMNECKMREALNVWAR